MKTEVDETRETLMEMRSIMRRSARIISLGGVAGIWTGCVAVVGAIVPASC